MSTDIRPEVSDKNKYYISKHRYYELLHFCRQYSEWEKRRVELYSELIRSQNIMVSDVKNYGSDVERIGIMLAAYDAKKKIVEDCAKDADPEIYDYIMRAVTKGVSYENLSTRFGIPCGRSTFYDRYRRFFWLLDTMRN